MKSNPEYKPVGNHLKCSATGPGMKGGIVGKACLFSVDVKDAGQGKLALALTGPSKTELTRSDSSSGYEYQFVPKVAGEYTLKIAFSDKDIPGSPFLIHISETERKLFVVLIVQYLESCVVLDLFNCLFVNLCLLLCMFLFAFCMSGCEPLCLITCLLLYPFICLSVSSLVYLSTCIFYQQNMLILFL